MISSAEMSYISDLLPNIIPADKVEDDKWVVNNNFYGVEFPTVSCDVVLFLGGRYGIEILLTALRDNNKILVVIENDAQKRLYVEQLREKHSFLTNRLFLFSDLSSEQIPSLLTNKVIAARVSRELFSYPIIEGLLNKYNIKHICGEFISFVCDPLVLYRLCESNTESFHWYISELNKTLVGQKNNYDYEVSVIVPAYNVGEYIDQCIESLAIQSLEKIEVIVVDDGTPDDSGMRADQWAEKFPGRVKVVHKVNGGCASARNAGIQAAKGRYIGFVDGDDWVAPRMYEDLYRSAILESSDIAQCGFLEAYTTGEMINFPLNVNVSRIDLLSERPTMWRRIYSSAMLRAKSITFPEHIKRFDDLPFQFETFLNAKSVSSIPFCYYYYRQGRMGQDISVRDDRLYVHFPIFDWIYARNSQSLNFQEEKKLFQLELDVHYWAYSVIDDKLKKEYLNKTAAQIFKAKVNLKFSDMFLISRHRGPNRFVFFLKLYLNK